MDNEDINADDSSKAVMLFGRDLRKIPCIKYSLLYGIYSGFGIGIITFMLTSRVKLSTHVAFGSYMGVSLIYWLNCRYTFVKERYAIREVQQLLRQQGLRDQEENVMEDKDKLIDV